MVRPLASAARASTDRLCWRACWLTQGPSVDIVRQCWHWVGLNSKGHRGIGSVSIRWGSFTIQKQDGAAIGTGSSTSGNLRVDSVQIDGGFFNISRDLPWSGSLTFRETFPGRSRYSWLSESSVKHNQSRRIHYCMRWTDSLFHKWICGQSLSSSESENYLGKQQSHGGFPELHRWTATIGY
jgi:hypothetical protein